MLNDYTGQFMPTSLFIYKMIHLHRESKITKRKGTEKESSMPFSARLHVSLPIFFIQLMLILISLNNTAPISLQDITLKSCRHLQISLTPGFPFFSNWEANYIHSFALGVTFHTLLSASMFKSGSETIDNHTRVIQKGGTFVSLWA